MDDFLLGLRVVCPGGMWPGREVKGSRRDDQHEALSGTVPPRAGRAPMSEGDIALLACTLSDLSLPSSRPKDSNQPQASPSSSHFRSPPNHLLPPVSLHHTPASGLTVFLLGTRFLLVKLSTLSLSLAWSLRLWQEGSTVFKNGKERVLKKAGRQ